jgi:hypothetical protein
MEVTGVVLGGIPIILWALENYRVALNPAKDYWRYDSTLSIIKMNIFAQQEQLKVTLNNIGLQDASLTEVERHLRVRSPEKCDAFMNILGHMDKIVQRLMDKLDIDLQGKVRLLRLHPPRLWHPEFSGFCKAASTQLHARCNTFSIPFPVQQSLRKIYTIQADPNYSQNGKKLLPTAWNGNGAA